MTKYKLIFQHWRTGNSIEHVVIETGFPVQGTRDVFFSLTENRYIDVIRDTIVLLEVIKDTNDEKE